MIAMNTGIRRWRRVIGHQSEERRMKRIDTRSDHQEIVGSRPDEDSFFLFFFMYMFVFDEDIYL